MQCHCIREIMISIPFIESSSSLNAPATKTSTTQLCLKLQSTKQVKNIFETQQRRGETTNQYVRRVLEAYNFSREKRKKKKEKRLSITLGKAEFSTNNAMEKETESDQQGIRGKT
ncbi:CLUMA_CG016844, isoform A [Clunio marinus]|uniref:CLUMA_CG016844, isoform A n=1 Tax=Clunio marinus TaxID=568069 RepID=A0A1J1IX41_9DIPT|nr:CLUMA_CG016844, isoform A [Clunio marinus]